MRRDFKAGELGKEEALTYYCCRSEAVSRGLKEGALCNKPNKEVIDRSTGRSPPAETQAAASSQARFCPPFLSVGRVFLRRAFPSVSRHGRGRGGKRVFWPACKLGENKRQKGEWKGREGWACVGQGAPCGEGRLSRAQPISCCLPLKPLLLSD